MPIGKEGVVDTKDPEMFSVCIKLCNLFPRPRAMACATLGNDQGKQVASRSHLFRSFNLRSTMSTVEVAFYKVSYQQVCLAGQFDLI